MILVLLLLSLRRSLHVLAPRRLLTTITGVGIRWTGLLLLLLLLLLLIERLLGYARIPRGRSMRLILGIGATMPRSILLIALTRIGLTARSFTGSSSSAGSVAGLGLIALARGQTPAGGGQWIVATAAILVVIVSLLAPIDAVIPSDDALPFRFCGDGANAAVVLTRLRVVSPISSASTCRILLPIAPRDRWGGLVHHPGDVAAHDFFSIFD